MVLIYRFFDTWSVDDNGKNSRVVGSKTVVGFKVTEVINFFDDGVQAELVFDSLFDLSGKASNFGG